jgi:hypothetical protein
MPEEPKFRHSGAAQRAEPGYIEPGSMPLLRKKNLRSTAMSNFPEPSLYLLIGPRLGARFVAIQRGGASQRPTVALSGMQTRDLRLLKTLQTATVASTPLAIW